MKKVLLVCCFVAGVSTVSLAQGGGRRTPAEQVTAMKTALSLTDDQATKITAILTAQAKTRDSLTTAANGDRAVSREKMQPFTVAYTAKIKAVLTPEQATAYQKQQDEMRAARGGN